MHTSLIEPPANKPSHTLLTSGLSLSPPQLQIIMHIIIWGVRRMWNITPGYLWQVQRVHCQNSKTSKKGKKIIKWRSWYFPKTKFWMYISFLFLKLNWQQQQKSGFSFFSMICCWCHCKLSVFEFWTVYQREDISWTKRLIQKESLVAALHSSLILPATCINRVKLEEWVGRCSFKAIQF